MESKEEYGRTYATIRWRDVEELAKYAHAANMPTQTALDNVISAGLKARWEELENIRFKEWEEEGQDEP